MNAVEATVYEWRMVMDEEYINKVIAFVQNLAARQCRIYGGGANCLTVNGRAFCVPCEARIVIGEGNQPIVPEAEAST